MPDWKSLATTYAAESSIHGIGLFAKIPISRGSFIGVYEGERTTENGMHVLWVEDTPENWVGYDGTSDLRFLNHSKTPNAELDGQDLYALQDIDTDEEITIDYGQWFAEDS